MNANIHIIITIMFNATRFSLLRQVYLCKCMVRFYELLDAQPLFFDGEATREIAELGQVFADTYNALAQESYLAGLKCWKGTPKLHIWLHLCQWQVPIWGNPRAGWTYADEDMVGKMIVVARSCHPHTMAVVTLWKWLISVFSLNE